MGTISSLLLIFPSGLHDNILHLHQPVEDIQSDGYSHVTPLPIQKRFAFQEKTLYAQNMNSTRGTFIMQSTIILNSNSRTYFTTITYMKRKSNKNQEKNRKTKQKLSSTYYIY